MTRSKLPEKKFILGIDQSITCTGLVVLESVTGEMVHHEVVRPEYVKNDPASLYVRISAICDAVRAIIDQYKIKTVCLEGLSFASAGQSTRDLAGLHCVLVMMLRQYERPNDRKKARKTDKNEINDIRLIAPTALKKAATGRGAWKTIRPTHKKQPMLDACPDAVKSTFEAYGKSVGRYDLADAYHLARCALKSVAYVVPAQHVSLFRELNIKD